MPTPRISKDVSRPTSLLNSRKIAGGEGCRSSDSGHQVWVRARRDGRTLCHVKTPLQSTSDTPGEDRSIPYRRIAYAERWLEKLDAEAANSPRAYRSQYRGTLERSPPPRM